MLDEKKGWGNKFVWVIYRTQKKSIDYYLMKGK